MISALLLSSLAALPTVNSSSTATVSIGFGPVPKLLLTPTWTPKDQNARQLSAVNAFSEELAEVARAEFGRRRWQVVEPNRTPGKADCATAECYSRLALSAGASHWLASKFVMTSESRCAARVIIYDMRAEKILRRRDVRINPCTADRLLQAAHQLGVDTSEGARAAPPITVDLTPRSIIDLDIPDIPDFSRTQTETSTTDKRRVSLPLALENYRRKHMVLIFVEGTYDQVIIVRDGKAISECDALRAASQEVSAAQREWCDGNYWEWAWLGVGGGALVSYASARSMTEGEFGGVFFYSLGIATVIASGITAIVKNENAKDPHEGRHQMRTEQIMELVARSNAALRKEYGLSESEVEVAGYRR